MSQRHRKPNLMVIGAMKSGTTSLHNYLALHDQIFMCEPKEPGYFVEEIAWSRGEEWYLDHFAEATEEHRYLGESSTEYTKLPYYAGVAEKIAAFNPDVKLIYMMRHPVDRLISHFWHAVRHAPVGGPRMSVARNCTPDSEYVCYGDYVRQLEPFLERFPRENIHLILFEDFVEDPRSEVRRVLDWLELTPELDWSRVGDRHNGKPDELQSVGGLGILNKIAHSDAWGHVSPYFPKRLKEVATRWSYSTIDTDEQEQAIECLRKRMQPLLQRQIDELSVLLNRDLGTIWRA